MTTFTKYLNQQLNDPEFAKVYEEVSVEEDAKLRQAYEHALATAFVSMEGTFDAGERQRYWLECLRLAKEIERLNE